VQPLARLRKDCRRAVVAGSAALADGLRVGRTFAEPFAASHPPRGGGRRRVHGECEHWDHSRLAPPAIGPADELVEVTPQSVRLRKRHLDPHERKKASRRVEG
jgi:hypothetical protein